MRKSGLFLLICLPLIFCSCSDSKGSDSFAQRVPTGSMELRYAQQFNVDYYDKLSVITIGDKEKYLLLPEGEKLPEDIPQDMTVITQPAESIYLAATSAADHFDVLNAYDNLLAVSLPDAKWPFEEMRNRMICEDILFAGKYSSPDYELLVSEQCGLAIESTMIYHTPEVKEQLERLGIPVLIERSSYEQHPLGRMEWIKLYGLLTGRTDESESFFNEKADLAESVSEKPSTGKTAAFFYVSPSGKVTVRKPGDYVSKMIELAGGEYIFTADSLNTDENALATVNIQFEAFYDIAKDADVLIYNSTIDGGISSLSDLEEKNSLFSEFRAFRNGDVWCTDKDMFLQVTASADMTSELYNIFSGNGSEDDNRFFHRLK
ncbi:MAG: ABC transporter substrate-binding protein [Huintestinicola sp.]